MLEAISAGRVVEMAMKECPFCGESIQGAAIKCRYCAEWLEKPSRSAGIEGEGTGAANGGKQSQVAKNTGDKQNETLIYEGSPSYGAMLGCFVLAGMLAVMAIMIMCAPTDNEQLVKAKITIGLVMIILDLAWVLGKMAVVKSRFYRLTPERLESHSGIIAKRVDNIDLFRVTDYKMERTIIDRLMGVGTVKIFTSDKTDPEFKLLKIKDPQRVFEILSKSTIEADSKRNVVHLE